MPAPAVAGSLGAGFGFERDGQVGVGIGATEFESEWGQGIAELVEESSVLSEPGGEEAFVDGFDEQVEAHVFVVDVEAGVGFTGVGRPARRKRASASRSRIMEASWLRLRRTRDLRPRKRWLVA
jgi:hypothetical protein